MPAVVQRNALLRPVEQRHRRIRIVVEVEVTADLIQDRARTHDLSAGGMFVDSALDYLVGMVVNLSFQLYGHRFEMRARVVHVKPQVGFGAQFLDLAPAERNHLLRLVHCERATREAERLLRMPA